MKENEESIIHVADGSTLPHDSKCAEDGGVAEVFDVAEQMPEYPGGMQALYEFLKENIKYPEDAKKQKVEGRVIATFVVETDGSISNVEVVKHAFPSLDAEAVSVIQAMPKWTPGKQSGKVVRVKYTVPVNFNLK